MDAIEGHDFKNKRNKHPRNKQMILGVRAPSQLLVSSPSAVTQSSKSGSSGKFCLVISKKDICPARYSETESKH